MKNKTIYKIFEIAFKTLIFLSTAVFAWVFKYFLKTEKTEMYFQFTGIMIFMIACILYVFYLDNEGFFEEN